VGDVLTLSYGRALVVLILGSLAGCTLDVDYSTGNWSCESAEHVCPNGFTCSSAGRCERVLQPIADASLPADEIDAADRPDAAPGTPDARPTPDAAPGTPDARPLPPDAPPPPPDAALPPDAPPPPPDAGVPPTIVTFTAVRDTQLFSPDPTFNFGNFAEIKCAARVTPTPVVDSPVLFGFNVSMIPAGAHVVSATMRLTVSSNAMAAGVVSAYALKEDWAEGGQDGTPGVANYVQRTSTRNWSTPGAGSASRVEPAFATFAPNQPETSFDFPLPPAVVEGWIESSNNNFGVVLTCPLGQDVTFYTRAALSASDRPHLTVAFTP
jgi:hypothetical protein